MTDDGFNDRYERESTIQLNIDSWVIKWNTKFINSDHVKGLYVGPMNLWAKL